MIAAVHEVLVEIDVAALDEDEALLGRLAAHDLLLRDVGAPRDDAEPVQAVEHGRVRHVGDAHVIGAQYGASWLSTVATLVNPEATGHVA